MTHPNLDLLFTQLTCGEDEAAEKAAGEIAALGEEALPALFDLTGSADADERWWGARTLAEIQGAGVQTRLQSLLDDPNPTVQQCAALGLSRQPYHAAIPALIDRLDAEDRLLASLAGDALIATGSAAVPALIRTLENGTPAGKIEAARALAGIQDPNAIPVLFSAWQEGSAMVRYWAEEGFERMGVGMLFFKPE